MPSLYAPRARSSNSDSSSVNAGNAFRSNDRRNPSPYAGAIHRVNSPNSMSRNGNTDNVTRLRIASRWFSNVPVCKPVSTG